MTLEPVESSNIEAIGYDQAGQRLHVKFVNGKTYEYQGVTEDQHKALMSSESKGGYFSRHIRGRHAHRKLG